MIERQFAEHRLAALCDRFYPPERRADFVFYLPFALPARAVPRRTSHVAARDPRRSMHEEDS
ncbi:MAG TPA: hypothetical protein VFL91_15020 [Thermomicrobiales bacterium]|nr:hypothetical protein [Thermomicrobiales bacterium]